MNLVNCGVARTQLAGQCIAILIWFSPLTLMIEPLLQQCLYASQELHIAPKIKNDRE